MIDYPEVLPDEMPIPVEEVDDYVKKYSQIFNTPDEFLTPQQILDYEQERLKQRTPPTYKTQKLGTILVWKGLATAIEAATIVLTLYELATALKTYRSPRKRRRQRNAICVGTCLGIINSARQDVMKGYAKNRALESKIETQTRRKYESRR